VQIRGRTDTNGDNDGDGSYPLPQQSMHRGPYLAGGERTVRGGWGCRGLLPRKRIVRRMVRVHGVRTSVDQGRGCAVASDQRNAMRVASGRVGNPTSR